MGHTAQQPPVPWCSRVYLQFPSHFWLPIHDFIFPERTIVLVLGAWVGWPGVGGSARLSSSPPPGMHWKGGEVPPPPLQGAQPMPSHCLPDAKCQPQWHV